MEALTTAQSEMITIVASRRISTALTKHVPTPADGTYKIGEEVLVFF